MSAVQIQQPAVVPALFAVGDWVTSGGKDKWQVAFVSKVYREGRLYGLVYDDLHINMYESELQACSPPYSHSNTEQMLALFKQPTSRYYTESGCADPPSLHIWESTPDGPLPQLHICECHSDNAKRIIAGLALLDLQAGRA